MNSTFPFELGDLRIGPVVDGLMAVRSRVLYPGVDEEEWSRHPDVRNGDGDIVTPYGGFGILGPKGQVVVIDVGAGPNFEVRPERATLLKSGQFLDCLRGLGLGPEDVTDVVLTHLHLDHIGWGAVDGLPIFPNARYVVHRRDWEWFTETEPDQRVLDSLGPAADQFYFWETDHELFPWLGLIHAPGHTPGTAVVEVSSNGQTMAFVGDIFHCPIELERPEWHGGIDVAPELARDQRHHWRRKLRDSDTLLAGPHFPEMRPGHLTAAGWRPVNGWPSGV